MVTYINADNAQKYSILFDEAAQALLNDTILRTELELPDDFAIGSLNDYYAYLEKLMKLHLNDEDEDSEARRNLIAHFARVPVDEDLFKINANSRTITVPNSSFGRYGVGVQGDVLAEVVYFAIDRYFDSTDLAGSDINIAVQWEARDEEKNLIAGLSKNFGKDIVMIDGHPSIIFGWPISPELTAAAGKIKFAVRFYKFSSEGENGTKSLVYNFNTLPAEVSINASLNYDIINSAIKEVDYGKVITGRIKSDGIYDPNAEIPSAPIITIPLFIKYPEGLENAKIVDLQENGDPVQLAISAKKSDYGVIGYDWQRYEYINGDYERSSSTSISDNIRYLYVPVDPSLGNPTTEKEYYTGASYENGVLTNPKLVTNEEIETIYVQDGQFVDSELNTVELYYKLSVASVNTVGEYAVDVTTRKGVNTSTRTMPQSERIRIPGPKKPVIGLPEETENISVTEDDQIVHAIINDDHSVTLVVNAQTGEFGKPEAEVGHNPSVSLSYNWKKVSGDGVVSDIVGTPAVMPVQVISPSNLPTDPAWLENTEEDGVEGAKGIFNQNHVIVSQNGTDVTIYLTDELKEYLSTNPSQGSHQWVALDIDTEEELLEGSSWNDFVNEVYYFTAEDDAEPHDCGVDFGHLCFWIKIDEALTTTIRRKINDTTLTFKAEYLSSSNNITYIPSGSALTISNLPEEGVDQSYFCEVTAVRNNVSVTENSGNYRVTNPPQKPVLTFLGEAVTRELIATPKKDARGDYFALSFDVDDSIPSDKITYLWMHANINDENDREGNYIKAQVDLGGALSDILGESTNLGGTPDIICESNVASYDTNGKIVFTGETGSAEYQLNENSEGIYYCIVINELNNNKAASVGPFFSISSV